MPIHTSAPATLMLMGEHAVLRNYPCLVAATNLRLHAHLSPREDKQIHIKSALGEHHCDINNIEITAPFTFALSVIKQFKNKLTQGFDLSITSEFSATQGLGSSAATLVAITRALEKFTELSKEHNTTFDTAKKSLHEIQGQGSGADLSAALLGGIIYYQIEPLLLEKLPCELPIIAIYSGNKKPTREMINFINDRENSQKDLYQNYFKEINQAVIIGKTALIHHDINQFAQALTQNQIIMDKMGLSNDNIRHIIQRLNQDPGILAAKISGSGLGDCVIGLGQLNQQKFPQDDFEQQQDIKQINLNLSPLGLMEHD